MNNQTVAYYRRIDVYEKVDDCTIAIYVCFELLGLGYTVQNANYIVNGQAHPADFENQYRELFLDVPPAERLSLSKTLEEALQLFKEAFN